MIEILYSTIFVLGVSVLPFFLSPTFQYTKIYFYLFQFLVWIILICLDDYKNHYLYDQLKYETIQEHPYPPIKKIQKEGSGTSFKLKIEYLNTKYSLVKTDEYSKECLEEYYIPSNEDCPYTSLYIEYDSTTHPNHNDIEITENSNNAKIYYRNDNKYGKLYYLNQTEVESRETNALNIEDKRYKIEFLSSFDYKTIALNKILEDFKLKNPYKNFKNYINSFCDYIYLYLFIISLGYYFMESKKDSKWNYFKIIDCCAQIIMFILYFFRFFFFAQIKSFFYKNKEIFKSDNEGYDTTKYNKEYYPTDFSIQSFPIAISISMIVYFILHLIFPNKCSCKKTEIPDDEFAFFNDVGFDSKKGERIFMIGLPFIIIYFISFIVDTVNDSNIRKIYKSSIDNWVLNPITSIELSPKEDHELANMYFDEMKYSFYKWKDSYFTVKRDSNYNYIKIYPIESEKGKLCGKDSFGNELYFPNDVECPINDIIIGERSTTHSGYTEVNLENSLYLYYTNKKTDGNILVDIKAGPNTVPLQLNYDKSNEICDYLKNESYPKTEEGECEEYFNFNTIPFYKEISTWNFNDFLTDTFKDYEKDFGNVFLYAFTYQGIDSNSIKSREKIKHYKNNMDNFKGLIIFKDILTSFNIIYFLFFSIILLKQISNKYFFIISLIILGLLFFHFIILLVCLILNIIYIQNFMNKINADFDYHKRSYGWTLALMFLDIFFILYYASAIIYAFMVRFNAIYRYDWIQFEKKLPCKLNCLKPFKVNQNNTDENNQNQNGPISDINHINHINVGPASDQRPNDPVEINEAGSDHLCLICMTNKTQVVLSPCGHKCLCDSCYNQYKESGSLINCPYCKTKIESVLMRVYSI